MKEKNRRFTTKAEMARQHIQEMILSGVIGAGERITTREVSATLGISETPIREAIRSLAAEGWLDVQSHIGAVVQGLRPEQIREISALRGRVSELAIELGATSFNAARLEQIDESIADYAKALAARDYRAVAEINYRFHELLCDNPESPLCHHLIENMHGQMSAQRHGIPPNHGRLTEALEEHKRIRDMLRLGDFAGAAEMTRQHEMNTGDFLILMIESRQVQSEQDTA